MPKDAKLCLKKGELFLQPNITKMRMQSIKTRFSSALFQFLVRGSLWWKMMASWIMLSTGAKFFTAQFHLRNMQFMRTLCFLKVENFLITNNTRKLFSPMTLQFFFNKRLYALVVE